MSTRRERLEAKADRREEWAEARERRARSAQKTSDTLMHRDPATGRADWALVTQPGHIPQRAQANRAQERAWNESNAASAHRAKAAGLRDQIDNTIFSDDDDATEQLEAKAQRLEARRDAMKKANAAWRKAKKPDLLTPEGAACLRGILPDSEVVKVVRRVSVTPYYPMPFPPYSMTNLGATIRNARARVKTIEHIEARQAEAEEAGGVKVERVGTNGEHACITFAEYPGRDTIQALKAAGFWWSRPSWHGPASKIPACVEVTP